MAILKDSFDVPLQDPITHHGGMSQTWAWFFRSVYERLYALGAEKSFQLANNQSSAADIDGLRLNKRGVSQAVVDYLVQRVTTGSGAQELIESGTLIFAYKPTSDTWEIVPVSEDLPTDAGVTISITSAGQVQYTTTSISGTPFISRIVWRSRSLIGKHPSYSSVGSR